MEEKELRKLKDKQKLFFYELNGLKRDQTYYF